MELEELISKLDRNMPVAIQVRNNNILRYDTVADLWEDFLFYQGIRFKLVKQVWYSKNLYNCLVIETW